ncbi:MAG TPA: histidine--tRNA ligase [Dehalococcoidia bacterium]|nr:histidine--tRNA ligase [Dehalococcoidia bacterium]
MPEIQAPRGTQDILPEEQPWWDYIRTTAERICGEFRYLPIDTPLFEDVGLFKRTVGDVTDIVQKEMYVFEDRGGQQLALRPEATAAVCRAYIEHGMHNQPQPVRLFSIAPMFRYDRPQAGRQRQFHQFNVEAIGDESASVDAETIEILWRLYEELGLTGLTLHLNTIGDSACRPRYLEALQDYYRDKLDKVCDDCRGRVERNPLRLLDCKNERCQPVIAGAPAITEYLCDECAEHFGQLKSYLDALGIPFVENRTLVRGLDYYTRTVYEVQPQEEGGQSTIGGGGRYDGLIEMIGGKPTPGVGFATGMERIILNLKRQEVPLPDRRTLDLFVVAQSAEARVAAFKLASDVRKAGHSAVAGSAGRSFKAQMRHADSLGARYAAIIGERELSAGNVALKRLEDGAQEEVAIGDVATKLAAP